MKQIAFAIIFLIIYGSLYPFDFELTALSSDIWKTLFDFSPEHSGISDALGNILLFVPLGLLSAFYARLPEANKYLKQFPLAMMLCFLFAFAIQILQLFVASRQPFGADAIYNVLGYAIAYALYDLVRRRFASLNLTLSYEELVSVYILVLLFIVLHKPFVPTLDVGLVYQNIKHTFDLTRFEWADFFEFLGVYLLCLLLLKRFLFAWRVYVPLIVATCVLQIFIIESHFVFAKILGAIGAVAAFAVLHKQDRNKLSFVFLLLCYAFSNLLPLEFIDTRRAFSLVPFQAYLEGDLLTNASALLFKFSVFLGMLWYSRLQKLSLRHSVVTLAVLVFIIEVMQARMVTGSSDITDILLVLFAAFVVKQQFLLASDSGNQKVLVKNESSTEVSEELGFTKSLFRSFKPLLVVFICMVLGQAFVMSLPNLPYNVAELYGDERSLINYSSLAAAYLLFCFGGVSVAKDVLFGRLHVFKAPLKLALLSMIVLLCLQIAVTNESIRDINGSSNIVWQIQGDLIFGQLGSDFIKWLGPQNVGAVTDAVEPFIRFSALIGPILYFSLISTLLLYRLFTKQVDAWLQTGKESLFLLPWFFLCKLIQFDYSSTDNLNELIARDGDLGLGGGGFLYLLFFLLVFLSALFAWCLAKKKVIYCLLVFVLLAVSLPLNWWLLNQGLEDNVQKYGLVYSGVDFLLGPDRTELLPDSELRMRWFLVNIMAYLSLGSGYLLAYVSIFGGKLAPEHDTTETRLNKVRLPFNFKWFLVSAVLVLIVVALTVFNNSMEEVLDVNPSWSGNDANIVLDLHAHSTYSDGKLSPTALVELANEHGCDALAITDHANYRTTFSSQRNNDVADARAAFPNMFIFNGVELNPPPYEGREHANIITVPTLEKAMQDNIRAAQKRVNEKELNKELFFTSILADNSVEEFFAIYNHPSRKDKNEFENEDDLRSWRSEHDLLKAISGAPGHQNKIPIGSYETLFTTIDRWDPAVAVVGSTWDRLLAEGEQVWGAIAVSDYHNEGMDYAPCEFARIRLSAPSFSYEGIIKGLRAGTFFADHGRLLNQLKFTVQREESARLYAPGDIVNNLRINETATVNVRIERDEGSLALPFDVEMITNCLTGKVEAYPLPAITPFGQNTMSFMRFNAKGKDGKSCYARLRLSATVSEERFYAYTNHIRFIY